MLDQRFFDIVWYVGAAFCFRFFLMFLLDVIDLSKRKKNSVLTKGTVVKCTVEKKWSYNTFEVKYEYSVNGVKRNGVAKIKAIYKQNISARMPLDIYYEKDHPDKSFPEKQIITERNGMIVLLVLAVLLIVSVIMGF